MDDEPRRPPRHSLGDSLERLSVVELQELRTACLAEAERIAAEVARRDRSKAVADSVFKR